MRLLDAEALIYDNIAELVDFPDVSSAPPYAILSHTWEQEEVLFHDVPLGPQHEFKVTAASVRALQRRRVVLRRNSITRSSGKAESDRSNKDSGQATMLHALSDYADKFNITPLKIARHEPIAHTGNTLNATSHIWRRITCATCQSWMDQSIECVQPDASRWASIYMDRYM